jgi:metal-responsive CopG/Arc/MetJ family transcriptional regulator
MATEKPRILLTVNEELLDRIDDYRYGNRIPTRSEAIRQLIEESLKRFEKKVGKA